MRVNPRGKITVYWLCNTLTIHRPGTRTGPSSLQERAMARRKLARLLWYLNILKTRFQFHKGIQKGTTKEIYQINGLLTTKKKKKTVGLLLWLLFKIKKICRNTYVSTYHSVGTLPLSCITVFFILRRVLPSC